LTHNYARHAHKADPSDTHPFPDIHNQRAHVLVCGGTEWPGLRQCLLCAIHARAHSYTNVVFSVVANSLPPTAAQIRPPVRTLSTIFPRIT
jgi:hypothetical protein